MEKSTPDIQPLRSIIRSSATHEQADEQQLEHLLKGVQDKCNSLNPLKDLVYFTISHSARRTLPYGMWTCADGRRVLFNREYQPILDCRDGVYGYCDHSEWVGKDSPIASTQYFYDDHTSPVRLLTKHLGIPYMFNSPPSATEAKACRKSLLICLQKLQEFTPKEHDSVSRTFSTRDL